MTVADLRLWLQALPDATAVRVLQWRDGAWRASEVQSIGVPKDPGASVFLVGGAEGTAVELWVELPAGET